MSVSQFENLDFACAKAGSAIASSATKDDETIITDALGVLEDQGVYAMFLFLKSVKKEKSIGIIKNLETFLKTTPKPNPLISNNNNNLEIFDALYEIAKDLDNLLLTQDLLRQTLSYARYHIKAKQKKGTDTK